LAARWGRSEAFLFLPSICRCYEELKIPPQVLPPTNRYNSIHTFHKKVFLEKEENFMLFKRTAIHAILVAGSMLLFSACQQEEATGKKKEIKEIAEQTQKSSNLSDNTPTGAADATPASPPAPGSTPETSEKPADTAGQAGQLPDAGTSTASVNSLGNILNNLSQNLTQTSQQAVAAMVKECLNRMNGHPFDAAKTTPDKNIYAGVSVMGTMAQSVSDTVATDKPTLTVIYAGVNVLGSTTWELLNPNGWYCVVTSVNVQGTINVKLKKGAHLAETMVNVNVQPGALDTSTNSSSSLKIEEVP
jgi:hypothetical protein